MADNRYDQIGLEYYKLGDKVWNRLLLIGLLLLLSHMLQISPSEIDAAGAKVQVKDPVIIQGALGLLYLHYFWNAVINSTMSSSFLKLELRPRTARMYIRSAKMAYVDSKTKRGVRRTPKAVKRRVSRRLFALDLFMFPYALVLLALLASRSLWRSPTPTRSSRTYGSSPGSSGSWIL